MAGTLVVKPIQANILCDDDYLQKSLTPYCSVIVNKQRVDSKSSYFGGKNPCWDDNIVIRRNHEPFIDFEVRNKGTSGIDDLIGVCQINLEGLTNQSRGWFPLCNKGKQAGEILLEIAFIPDPPIQNSMSIVADKQNVSGLQQQSFFPLPYYPSAQLPQLPYYQVPHQIFDPNTTFFAPQSIPFHDHDHHHNYYVGGYSSGQNVLNHYIGSDHHHHHHH